MSLEQEIKDFMKSIGVDVVGLAGPDRFDGPPSLDPEYIMEGAKSIISFAIPMDVPAIYDFLQKKTAVPHNQDQYRGHQKMIHQAMKLVKFLEEKGHRATREAPNVKWRKVLNPMRFIPRFSMRYGAYVSGIAGIGLSGNAVTREYGAAVYLNAVITDAILESDPIIPPREIFDTMCQHCMACSAACPTKMFQTDEVEYSLLNGELYPRGKPRDLSLCGIGCGGLHAPAPNKRYSTWGRGYKRDWVGKIPDPKEQNILMEFAKGFINDYGFAPQVLAGTVMHEPLEEGAFEAPNVPDYDDLPGETESQKIEAWKNYFTQVKGYELDDGLNMTCGSCQVVCGPTVEESQKRWKMLAKSGFVVRGKDKEVVWTHDIEEALAIREKYPWVSNPKLKKTHVSSLFKTFLPKIGIDWHGMRHIGPYKRKLKKAIKEMGDQRIVDLELREKILEEIGANEGIAELN